MGAPKRHPQRSGLFAAGARRSGVEYATKLKGDKESLESIASAAQALGMPQVQWAAERKKRDVERKMQEGASADPKRRANAMLHRIVRAERAAQAQRTRSKREKNMKDRAQKRLLQQRTRAAQAALAQEKALRRLAAKEFRERLGEAEKLPAICTAEDAGAPVKGKKIDPLAPQFFRKRFSALNRLRLTAPKLPRQLEEQWIPFCTWYARGDSHAAAVDKRAARRRVGTEFVNLLNDLGKGLMDQPPDGTRFREWVAAEMRKWPRSATVAVLPPLPSTAPASAGAPGRGGRGRGRGDAPGRGRGGRGAPGEPRPSGPAPAPSPSASSTDAAGGSDSGSD